MFDMQRNGSLEFDICVFLILPNDVTFLRLNSPVVIKGKLYQEDT